MTRFDPNERERILAGTYARARTSIAQRFELLQVATAALAEGRLDGPGRAAAELEAHRLAGSAGTFGLPRVSELARELEAMLGAGSDSEAPPRRAQQLVAEISEALAANARERSDEAGRVDSRPLVLLVHRDTAQTVRLVSEAQARGVRAVVAHDASGAWEAAARHRPAAALVELSTEDPNDELLRLISHLAATGAGARVVVMVGGNATATHLAAIDAGACAVVDARSTPADIVDAVARELDESDDEEVYRVVAVDDDPDVAAALRIILESERIRLTPLCDPTLLWEALAQHRPDLIILDVEMPSISGLDLCRLIRANPRWRGLPVIFLSARQDQETVRRVFDMGADDYVTKPILGPELVSRVRARLERSRLHRMLAETDPLTGLANRRRLEERFNRLLALSQRQGQPLSLAVLDVDHFKAINDRYGHGVGDLVLKHLGHQLQRAFRRDTVVARIGGEEFVVVLAGATEAQTVSRLTDVLGAFRDGGIDVGAAARLRVSVSAGVASGPADGRDLHVLYRLADQALGEAKRAGRDRVLAAGQA